MANGLPQWSEKPQSSTGSIVGRVSALRSPSRLIILCLCGLVTLSFLSGGWSRNVVGPSTLYPPQSHGGGDLDDINNSTLGFHKIYAIGFPERTDKRDAKTLASSFTGFDIEWLPAVKFEDVARKAAPPTWNFDKQSPGALGCWRAHMNALEHIIANHIQSAVIMEDDADWDVNLKQQLVEFAHGTRALQQSSPSPSSSTPPPPTSPYGRDWDFLWLGHCRVGPSDDEQDFWIIENDITSPPVNKRWAGWRNSHFPAEVRSNNTRIVLRPNGGMCLYSYAVTFDGARKILASLSLQSQDSAVDASMSNMCRGRFARPFRCFAPFPPLLSTHRAAGPQSRDSDLNDKSDRWHQAYTWDIVYSTILNIAGLVQGSSVVKAQWPDAVAMPEMSFDPAAKISSTGYLKTIVVHNETTSPP